MFVEAVVFLSAIIGVLLAFSALFFHVLTRKANHDDIESAVDAVTDVALDEINKTSQLVLDELNEKYKALLFVYQLMDDKHKVVGAEKAVSEGNSSWDSVVGEEDSPQDIAQDSGNSEKVELDISIGDELDIKPMVEELQVSLSTHPKYGIIKELLDGGIAISEIAKRLNMGQGEVQLIIGLSGR